MCRNGEVPLPKIFFQNLHKKLDKPNYSLNSETIRLDLYDGDPVQGTTELQVYSDGVKRIGLDQFNNGTIIFWTHK